MFEKDIQHITDTITLFEVTYKKDSFVIDGKEYPLGYTSYLAIQPDCRFMDTTVFAEIERFADSLTDDLSRDGLIEYQNRLITAIESLQKISFFSLFHHSPLSGNFLRLNNSLFIVYSYFRLYIIMRFLSITFRLLTEKKDFS